MFLIGKSSTSPGSAMFASVLYIGAVPKERAFTIRREPMMFRITLERILHCLFVFLLSLNTITNANGAWVSMPGTNNAVFALAIDKSGNLYAGGNFTTAGGISANHVARWDGNTWSALGAGTNDIVKSLACDDSGNVYAGGSFDSAGGIKTNRIARWDGKAWSALGSGIDNSVTVLAVSDSGHVYAGGAFNNAGDVSANRIARWDGRAWSALGGGISGGNINSLVIGNSGIVYVCNGAYIFKWNRVKWDTLGGADMNSSIFSLVIDKSNNLYAGGRFSRGTTANIIIWNGTSWNAFDSSYKLPTSTWYVSKLAVDDSGILYIQSADVSGLGVCVDRWNNSTNVADKLGCYIGSGSFPPGGSLCVDNQGNLYMGDFFQSVGGVPASNIAKYIVNGTSVNLLHPGISKQSPQPAIKSGILYFTLSRPSSIAYRIFDISGRSILQSQLGFLSAGNHAVKIESGNLHPGVYLLDFRAGNVSFKGKFSVTK